VDVVLLNSGVNGDIHNRQSLRSIHEVDCATLQDIPIAHEDQVATGQIDAAKNDRLRGRAADLQISGCLQAQCSRKYSFWHFYNIV